MVALLLGQLLKHGQLVDGHVDVVSGLAVHQRRHYERLLGMPVLVQLAHQRLGSDNGQPVESEGTGRSII